MGVRSRSGATRDAALPDSGHPVVLEQRFRFLEPIQEQKSERFSHVQGLLLYRQHVKPIKTLSLFPLSSLIFLSSYCKVIIIVFWERIVHVFKMFKKCFLTTKYCFILNHIINHFMVILWSLSTLVVNIVKWLKFVKLHNTITFWFHSSSVPQQIPSVHQRLELLDSVRPWRNLLWKRFLRSCQIRWRRHHWTGWKKNSIVYLNLSWMANKKIVMDLK